MIDDQTVLRLADDVTFQAMADGKETVLLSMTTGRLYSCNETTAAFLQAVKSADGGKSFGEAIGELTEQYDVAAEKLREDLAGVVVSLLEEKLLVKS